MLFVLLFELFVALLLLFVLFALFELLALFDALFVLFALFELFELVLLVLFMLFERLFAFELVVSSLQRPAPQHNNRSLEICASSSPRLVVSLG